MTEKEFLEQIEAHPHEAAPKLMYADWLEERGDQRAHCWREIARGGRVPQWSSEVGKFIWFYGAKQRRLADNADLPSSITRLVFEHLKGIGAQDGDYIMKIYSTAVEAYQDLVQAVYQYCLEQEEWEEKMKQYMVTEEDLKKLA